MKLRSVICPALTAALLICVISVRAQEAGQPVGESDISADADTAGAKNDSSAGKITSEATRKVIAYYFHSTRRCSSCRKIESYSAEIIRAAFDGELDRGLLEWRPVNTDESDKKHFLKDYELYTKSLVLSEVMDGQQVRWKNLERIWRLLNDKASFQKYVEDEVRAFLGEN